MSDGLSPVLREVSDAVLAVASNLSVEQVLQRLVDVSRGLVGARYAALGIPDGDGGFAQFLTAGMDADLVASLGPLPRQHGLLGAMLDSREALRMPDIHRDRRFRGWWPRGHPDMGSFLGVPIVSADGVIGAFYLTDKDGAPEFSAADQELIELLAGHAAIAITNARLYERTRELSIIDERNRVALELHDAVSQKLFGLVLAAEAADTLFETDPAAARAQLTRLRDLAQQALEELRDLILEPRPLELELETEGSLPPNASRDRELLRIAQEALQNALRHADAARVDVRLAVDDGRLVLEVRDDGSGFDPLAPEIRSRRLGLTSMEERARRIGGRLEVRSAAGEGTTVRLEAPLG